MIRPVRPCSGLSTKIGLPAVAAFITVFTILLVKGVIFPDLLQRSIYVPDGMSRVPSIVNTSLTDAVARLEEENLQYKVTGKKLSAQVPENLILLQNVNGGAVVLKNTVIVLDISAGTVNPDDLTTMPDPVYMDQSDAGTLLTLLDIPSFHVTYEESETIEKGLVMSQDVEPGTELSAVKAVNLVVSKGGKPFAMPDVRKMKEDAAKELLYEQGLSVTVAYGYGSQEAGRAMRLHMSSAAPMSRGLLQAKSRKTIP